MCHLSSKAVLEGPEGHGGAHLSLEIWRLNSFTRGNYTREMKTRQTKTYYSVICTTWKVNDEERTGWLIVKGFITHVCIGVESFVCLLSMKKGLLYTLEDRRIML